jgi:PAS domain S-box-containing protein
VNLYLAISKSDCDPIIPHGCARIADTESEVEDRSTGDGLDPSPHTDEPAGQTDAAPSPETRDLTERRRAEEALRESDQRFGVMIDSVIDYAIFMLDPDGAVATWNEGARQLKQYEEAEIIGRHFSAFYTLADRASSKPQRLLDEALRNGRVEDEGWRMRKDGSTFWADVVITALHAGDGRLIGFAKVTRDLTERRMAEESLREAAERERETADQLREAARSRQALVAIVAHDLRAPISVLQGSADLLLRDWNRLNSVDREVLLRGLSSTSVRLRELVDDVLDLTRIEAGKLDYQMGTVDLLDVVLRAAGDVDPGRRRIAVVPPADGALVRGDERRIWQIATNLMSNALKFSPSGAPVEVVVDVEGASARVTVTDGGVGITEEQQRRLFQPFSRIRESRGDGPESGTGLGLYIARSLVTAQGGEIGVSSEPGAGSTFHFTLPLAL